MKTVKFHTTWIAIWLFIGAISSYLITYLRFDSEMNIGIWSVVIVFIYGNLINIGRLKQWSGF